MTKITNREDGTDSQKLYRVEWPWLNGTRRGPVEPFEMAWARAQRLTHGAAGALWPFQPEYISEGPQKGSFVQTLGGGRDLYIELVTARE